MSLNREHDLMKTSFLEAKDIINKIFEYLSAPDYYFIQHMTFDELVVALYRLLGLYEGIYGDNPPHIEYIVDTFDGTATSDDILLGKIAYSKGQRIEGNIVSFPGHTYMPTTTDIVIPEKHYLEEDQIIKGDPDLLSENIRYNKNIFDIEGTFTEDANITANDIIIDKIGYAKGEKIIGRILKYSLGDIVLDEEHAEQVIEEGYHYESVVRIQTQEKYAHPGIHEQIIEPDDDHVLSRVFVDGDEDLIPKNIRKDVIIFDVVGELEEFTKYNIIYVINVLKQYAYQQQVEYGEQFSIIGTQPVLDDYEFKGWSPDPNAETVVYQPGQLVTTNLADKGGAYILYAVLEEMNLADITLDITYQNGGKLSNGQEVATVIVHGGNLSTGYSNVQRDLQCDNAIFISKFANETQNTYDNQLKFTEIGFYPVIVVHKRRDKQVQATGVIKVAGENGGMNGSGSMVLENGVAYYDSGWISTDIIKGCWISGFKYDYSTPGGHGSSNDNLAVFGRTSTGKTVLIYDFDNTANLKKEINIPNITGDLIKSDSYALNLGTVSLTKGDLGSQQHKSGTLTKADDIRQLRFFASSDHGLGRGCFEISTIDYDIQYEFDMDLWEEDKKRGDVHTHSYTYTVTTPATCGAKGLKTGTCSCGQTVTEPIPMTGKHTWNNGTITKQATCATAGIKTITCTVCGQTKTENIDATGNHSWNAGVVTKEPTTTATGVKIYTCNVCGKTKTETIPKLEPEPTVNCHYDQEPIQYEKSKWGIYEIKHTGLSTDKMNRYLSAYKRIYNACRTNHSSASGYAITNYNTKQTQIINCGYEQSHKFNFDDGTVNAPYTINIYLADLSLTTKEVSYIHGLVYADCPEVLMRWRWNISNSDFDSAIAWSNTNDGYVHTLYIPGWKDSDFITKNINIANVFQRITNKCKAVLGNNIVPGENVNYSALQKRNIAKIIYEMLVVENEYGDANSDEGYNQIVWPSMSYDTSLRRNIYKPVCASYAHGFKYCCQAYGIDAIWVSGNGGPAGSRDALHAWNIVNYDSNGTDSTAYHEASNWQEVDITWGDVGGYYDGAITYFYFNATTNDFHTGADGYLPGTGHHYKGYYGQTNYNTERYKTYPANGNCTCTRNRYNGSQMFVQY